MHDSICPWIAVGIAGWGHHCHTDTLPSREQSCPASSVLVSERSTCPGERQGFPASAPGWLQERLRYWFSETSSGKAAPRATRSPWAVVPSAVSSSIRLYISHFWCGPWLENCVWNPSVGNVKESDTNSWYTFWNPVPTRKKMPLWKQCFPRFSHTHTTFMISFHIQMPLVPLFS